jgi:hypothetical protein
MKIFSTRFNFRLIKSEEAREIFREIGEEEKKGRSQSTLKEVEEFTK